MELFGFGRDVMQAALAGLGIGDVGTFTLATLPDPAGFDRRTAWVTDLYGIGGRIVSEGGFWKPIRPLIAGNQPSANLATQPMVTPTTLILSGTIGTGVTHTISFGAGTGFALPFNGYRQRVCRKAGGLGTLLVNGVGLSLNSWADHEWDGSAWYQTASGGLL